MSIPTLSPEQSATLRKRLEETRADTLGHVRARMNNNGDLPPVSHRAHLGQPDDMAQAADLGDREIALTVQEEALLADIHTALARLDEGIANVCAECGADIPLERLLAVPTTRTCLACQQNDERRPFQSPAPTL